MTIDRRFVATAALFSAVVAVPATAQDAFQGPYVAAFAGGARALDHDDDVVVFDVNGDGSFGDPVLTPPGSTGGTNFFLPGFCDGAAKAATPLAGCKKDRMKLDWGIRAGYDGRPGGGRFLAGLLVEYQRSNAEDSTSAFSSAPDSYVITREAKDALNLRGRLGYVVTPRIMVYATGGPSQIRVKNRFRTTNALNTFTNLDDRQKKWGWQAGAGAEFALMEDFTLGLEYMYSTYDLGQNAIAIGQGTATADNPFGTGAQFRLSEEKFKTNAIRATLNFHF